MPKRSTNDRRKALALLRQEIKELTARLADVANVTPADRSAISKRARRIRDIAESEGDRELASAVCSLYARAMADEYPPGFWEHVARLKAGNRASIDVAITFLERDPWGFRSGYLKADLIRFINRLPLNEMQAARLRNVVLTIVDTRDGREFRSYCRLARKVDDPTLRSALRARLLAADRDIRRRVRWVLEALGEDPEKTNGATASAVAPFAVEEGGEVSERS